MKLSLKFTRRESHKAAVFTLTFFSYAFFHANRKAFSNVKSSTASVWTPEPRNESLPKLLPEKIWSSHHLFETSDDAMKFEGVLDTAFMLAYAVGLFLNGYIGDRVNMRILLSVGMASTGVLIFIFGCITEWVAFYNKYFYCSIWIINGLMQSTGWPVVVACMGNWFGKSSRGMLLGIWSSCASVGNILGAVMVSSVLSYGYQYAFLMTSTVILAGSCLVFFGLVPSPADVGMEGPDDDNEDSRKHSLNADHDDARIKPIVEYKATSEHVYIITLPKNVVTPKGPLLEDAQSAKPTEGDDTITYDLQSTKPTSMPFWKACLLPGVIPYSLAYAFLKLVNYSFFFWLPYYLKNAFDWEESEADKLSTAYDVAGIVGGIVVGFFSDRLGKRTILILPMLLVSIPSLFGYSGELGITYLFIRKNFYYCFNTPLADL
ncbi:sugar phosphate exchanger 3-like isoform X1 [Physella acuta]|uniref:sugar phosphate exchanger 3-like isoform X1 n=1 Tax=Physella acuta TaxID=109671 RepID=UPI0027DC8F53|nr:sugar phosphate exchanger 3-like isoform X1 [Physella acuta]